MRILKYLCVVVCLFCAPLVARAAGGACPSGVTSFDSRTPSATPGPLSAIGVTSCFFVASNGSDSQDGTEEVHTTGNTGPWKHAPGMPNCASVCASTTIVAGEGVIFRGNDTWDFGNSSLANYTGGTWNFSPTGNSSNLIYLGVDPAWFSGSSWGRPIFNGDNTPAPGGTPGNGGVVSSCAFPAGTNFAFINEHGNEYVVLDNFEFTGLCWNDAPNNSDTHSYIDHFGGNSQLTSFKVFSNLYIHGWTHTAFTPSTCSQNPEVGVCNTVQGIRGNTQQEQGTLITHTVIDGADSDALSFSGVDSDGYDSEYNIFRYLGGTQIIDNCHVLHDNLFEHINNDQSNSTHSDMWFCNGEFPSNNFFYNNLIRFIGTDFNQPLSAVVWSTPPGGFTDYYFGNVGHDVNCAGNCNNFNQAHTGTSIALIYNNTWQSNGGAIWTNGAITTISFTDANNHYIGTGATTCAGPYAKTSIVNSGNVSCSGDIFQTLAAANAQGYTSANDFQPTAGTNKTVGAGANEFSQVSAFGPAFASSTTNGCTYVTNNHTVNCPAVNPNVRWTSISSPGGDAGAYLFTSGGATVATPTFLPVPGSYVGTQSVAISSSTAGATITYTTDGSTPVPGSHGTAYTGPILVSVTQTVKAIGSETGFTNSAVATGSFTISPPNTVMGSPAMLMQ